MVGSLMSLICLLPCASANAHPGPVEVLQGMSDQVIAIVDKDPDILNDKTRMREVADGIVVPNVDFVLFSKWVLGKYWHKATPEQRKIFITEFTELLINSYLTSITRDQYQHQTVRYKPAHKTSDPKKVIVESEVVQPNGPVINVKFRMHLADTGWMVYDVVVEGVSLVATHRSSFSSIIRQKGIGGLITMLEERNIKKASDHETAKAAPAH